MAGKKPAAKESKKKANPFAKGKGKGDKEKTCSHCGGKLDSKGKCAKCGY
jgi:tRNA(Ile2) C34 agmatinyltransferase TiaS